MSWPLALLAAGLWLALLDAAAREERAFHDASDAHAALAAADGA